MAILKESWSSLTKPTSVDVSDQYDNIDKSLITIEPLARGFGNTIGNALRRVLLSSISGFGVSAIKIDGVQHEYSSIDGVKEDVIDIIMNLKMLSISKETPESIVLKLQSNTEGHVYAGQIDAPAGVEIINKDLLICTINQGGKIDMQIYVDSGQGYSTSDQREIRKEIGLIKIDTVFSPVKKVSYRVENARVGQITDYDKLIMEIETNGSISPRDALGTAAKILQDQLKYFVNFDLTKYEDNTEYSKGDQPEFNKNLLRTVDELELSVRSYNCLKNENIFYVGDLVTRGESEMLKIANFGRKSLNELKDNLKSMNLSFGMKIDSWPPKNIDELIKQKNKDF